MNAIGRREFLRLSGFATAAASLGLTFTWRGARPAYGADLSPFAHVLNRVTWAARREDLARITEMGIEAYLDWQLSPESIADPVVDAYVQNSPVSLSRAGIAAALNNAYGETETAILVTRLVRAAYSERQLYELVVEFWTDHFNIPIGDYVAEKTIDDREVIRKHALGKFRDLVFASAQSEAMLRYLNNDSSSKEHPNENYARELMELHTLGVDGGYSEADVKAVARAFTGWTVRGSGDRPFFFDQEMHDGGEKIVLGQKLAAGRGIEDGLEVLDILARHASTARFIAFKLCRRFVSDNPPQSLVESAAQQFSATDGDIRAVLRHILLSPEFMDSAGQKLRRPMDYLVGVMRLMRMEADDPWLLLYPLQMMGHIPFYWHPPNGYPDVAAAWINTNGLLTRWNIALSLPLAALGQIEGLRLSFGELGNTSSTAYEMIDETAAYLLAGGALSPNHRDMLAGLIHADPNASLDLMKRAEVLPALVALIFASPYFQWK